MNEYDYNFEELAERHVETWKERYYGKSRQEVIIDLDLNYDWSVELEDNEVPEEDIEEFRTEFIRAVLRELGLELSETNRERLEWCIDHTEGEVKETLEKLKEQLIY